MSPGPTFDRVYQALKDQLRQGVFPPGAPLEPAAIGNDLNASITPVRDALHRLAGERMVESPRHDGFRVPSPTEAGLRDLYGWTGSLVDLALRGAGTASAAPDGDALDASDGAAATAKLFLAVAHASRSKEHRHAISGLNDRLWTARTAEERLLEEVAVERGALWQALLAGDAALARRRLGAYHRLRQRRVPEILAAMHGERY